MLSLKEQIEQGIFPIIQQNGCELVDLQVKSFGSRWGVRVFIDKEQGVTVEDCALVSRKISDYLDTEDLIQSRYTLEISSPGLNRPLTSQDDFHRKKGETITLFTKDPQDNRNGIKGKIQDFKEETLYLETQEETISILWEVILKAQVVF